ncbi:tRNA (guanosine(37)-N1)-methyltransferase TrmD [Acidimangrovimonas sediminis]|uniref:tRNA (guanosine(37)-N1)-methyltransferase TrmD n=1 Tax=Acidimangrovimonas sediminis TaxID=2056283 RepID=UPI000C80CBCA|nr:tRNA (guanosine(37)-N1)-methyltransferase TrmD [Acidimangrovimonas sediminis]
MTLPPSDPPDDAPGTDPGTDPVLAPAEDPGDAPVVVPAKSHGRLKARPTLKPQELIRSRPSLHGAWTARIVTLFPEAFPGTLGLSLTGKALDAGLWQLETIDLRQFGEGKHRNVDDTPAGGGAGMVLRPDVVGAALAEASIGTPVDRTRWPVVYLSPRGTPFTQDIARRWSEAEGVTLLCGRFEGVDQRVIDHYAVEEVSLGDFVLTGGEIAAQAMIDAAVRLRPGVLGNEASAEEESHSSGLLEHPQYTRPAEWEGRKIPEVLMSGHHGKIAAWRHQEAEALTEERRPDLWTLYQARKLSGD